MKKKPIFNLFFFKSFLFLAASSPKKNTPNVTKVETKKKVLLKKIETKTPEPSLLKSESENFPTIVQKPFFLPRMLDLGASPYRYVRKKMGKKYGFSYAKSNYAVSANQFVKLFSLAQLFSFFFFSMKMGAYSSIFSCLKRISPSFLYRLPLILAAPVCFFFGGLWFKKNVFFCLVFAFLVLAIEFFFIAYYSPEGWAKMKFELRKMGVIGGYILLFSSPFFSYRFFKYFIAYFQYSNASIVAASLFMVSYPFLALFLFRYLKEKQRDGMNFFSIFPENAKKKLQEIFKKKEHSFFHLTIVFSVILLSLGGFLLAKK